MRQTVVAYYTNLQIYSFKFAAFFVSSSYITNKSQAEQVLLDQSGNKK
jgi:hypothetical protein